MRRMENIFKFYEAKKKNIVTLYFLYFNEIMCFQEILKYQVAKWKVTKIFLFRKRCENTYIHTYTYVYIYNL